MGVSYDFTVGYGFEVSKKRLKKIDPEQYEDCGASEFLDNLLAKEYPLLSYDWGGDAYSGDDSGHIVVVDSLSHTQYGWRVEKANIHLDALTTQENAQLFRAFKRFGKKSSGIGYFTASSVG